MGPSKRDGSTARRNARTTVQSDRLRPRHLRLDSRPGKRVGGYMLPRWSLRCVICDWIHGRESECRDHPQTVGGHMPPRAEPSRKNRGGAASPAALLPIPSWSGHRL